MRALTIPNLHSVLCLGAHSDDLEIGCGGTMLQLLKANPRLDVHWVVFSGGEARAAEAKTAAETILRGAATKSIELFDFRDSYFPDQWSAIKGRIAEIASEITPDLILTHHLNDRHQDHRVIAELTWCAFRNHLISEYEIPKFEGDLGKPNFYVPLSAADCEQKIGILMDCFASQTEKRWFDADLFRALMRLRGSECNAASGYAEAFHCRKATFQLTSTNVH